MNITLYQITFDGDVILYAGRDGLPVLVGTACWTESTDENYDPEDFVRVAMMTLMAVGHTVTLRKFDGDEMTYADGEEFNDGDIDAFIEEMQACLDAHGSDLPITSLPEIKEI